MLVGNFTKEITFGHERGTDTGDFRYIAVGNGKIKLDNNHDSYIIVTPNNYNSKRNSFYSLMRDMLDIGMFHLKKTKKQNISFEKYISQQSEIPMFPLEQLN